MRLRAWCTKLVPSYLHTHIHTHTHTTAESDDFETLREVGSININAEEGQTECFDVNIVNDDYYEQNETFKIMLDVKDANVFTLVDMVIVTIIDDDIAPSKYRYESSHFVTYLLVLMRGTV